MQERPHKRGGFIRLTFSLILLVLAVALFIGRQQVIDRVMVWRYQPNAMVQSLVEKSHMSPEGQFYFYASRPEINDREPFNKNCTSSGEQTVVLGCYAAQRIYIFDVTDQRLNGIKEVTAAHEMLHAAYDRLGQGEKERVDALIETQLKSVTDKRIQALIAVYARTEPGERLNELHSIFATELVTVTPELEAYYAQYFNDRAAVAVLSQQYEKVFSSLNQQQDALVTELNTLADSISARTQAYNRDTEQLNQDVDSFNNRANSGGYTTQASFDAGRNELLARQTQLAATRDLISADIKIYNQKRSDLEAINGQAAQLNQNINSNALDPAASI
ncbi:hypothetical protein H7Y40_02115 [Pedobacter sp.]|nr:hypothetical protein [Candidatus Saccharibacteria bacterium]